MESLHKLLVFIVVIVWLSACGEGTSGDSSGTGQAGSLASMTVAGGKLHILNNEEIVSYDLSGELVLQGKSRSNERLWQARTLSNYQNTHLLLGLDSGVEIIKFEHLDDGYTAHESVGRFEHMTARDPVISNGPLAFYTTRDGNLFSASPRDVVGVLDLNDLTQPELLYSESVLNEPEGLAFYQDNLFVCDLDSGLSRYQMVYDELEQFEALEFLGTYSEYECHDIIARNNHLVLISKSAITQLSVTKGELEELSKLEIFGR